MELCPVPRRSPTGGRRTVLGAALLVVLGLLLLVPAVLGLDRTVATDGARGDEVGPGSLVISRDVPAGDLRAGDLITLHPPGRRGAGTVTHRIVATGDAILTTSGASGGSAADPWRLPVDRATYPQVLVHVPYVGYLVRPPLGWALTGAVLAMAVWLLLSAGHLRRARRTRRAGPVRASTFPPPTALPTSGGRPIKVV